MNKDEFRKSFDERISNSSRIIIASHMGPDHDAICSSLGLLSYVSTINKNVNLYFSDEKNEGFSNIPNFDLINWVEDISEVIKDGDTLILIDGNNFERFSSNPDIITNKDIFTICIDHHKSPPDDFDLLYIDTSSSAASEIVFDLFYNENIDAINSLILAYGIMGDTGSLRFINENNAETLNVMKILVEKGKLDLEILNVSFLQMDSSSFDFYKELVKNSTNTDIINGPSLTYTFANKDKGKRSKFAMGKYHMEVLRLIKGYSWGFIVTFDELNEFNVSFRSQAGSPNVRLLCEKYFDGGGHDKAAGGKFIDNTGKLDSKEVAIKILEIINKDDLVINE